MSIIVRQFNSFKEDVPLILEKAGVGERVKDKKRLVLKPNLTTSLKPPCTTPVELVEEVVKFCQDNSSAEIVVAEGSGGCDTKEAFEKLGYQDLAHYIKSDFVLVDASIGQKGSEIHGDSCQPPIGKLIAGYSARQVDRFCAPLLGHKPKEIPWLS